ncbi:unnamed protein product [Linum trigynum]|uniref:Uncharacterized protein n=1 Tax=Linum trigynum TaxID=586398 RepID=A0AAV2GJ71_9ROSI
MGSLCGRPHACFPEPTCGEDLSTMRGACLFVGLGSLAIYSEICQRMDQPACETEQIACDDANFAIME